MSDKYDEYIQAIHFEAKSLAKELLNGHEVKALREVDGFILKFETDLKRWLTQLANKEINKEDFGDFVDAKKALLQMHSLTQEGIAEAKLERFRTGLIGVITDKASSVFG